jgi:hypothetical protein
VRGERLADRARHAHDTPAHRGRQHVIDAIDVLDVRLCRHENVAGIHVAEIHEHKRAFVLVHYARRNLLGDDPAEHALAHASPPLW